MRLAGKVLLCCLTFYTAPIEAMDCNGSVPGSAQPVCQAQTAGAGELSQNPTTNSPKPAKAALSYPAGPFLLPLAISIPANPEPSFLQAVYRRLIDWLTSPIFVAIFILFVLHSLIFAITAILARWHRLAWKLLLTPEWAGRIRLWFIFVLRHSRNMQRWLFELWFRERRGQLEKKYPKGKRDIFMPIPLKLQVPGMPEETVPPSEIFSRIFQELREGRKVWIQGDTGMGKSRLLRQLRLIFYASEEKSAFQAYRKHGLIPIVVHLSNIPSPNAQTTFSTEQPEGYLAFILDSEFHALGFVFPDLDIFYHIVHNGVFAPLLDGANDMEDPYDLEYKVWHAFDIPVLVTSTNPPEHPDQFSIFRFPSTAKGYAKDLVIWLLKRQGYSKEMAPEITAALDSEPIQRIFEEDVRTGYDARALARTIITWHQGISPHAGIRENLKSLPTSLSKIYIDLVEGLNYRDGTVYKEVPTSLCREAWRMTYTRDYKFSAHYLEDDEQLHLVNQLQLVKVGVIRHMRRRRIYILRNNALRRFLAIRYILTSSDPVELLKNCKEIWELDQEEQNMMWGFLAKDDELTKKGLREKLEQFAQDKDIYCHLANALNVAAANSPNKK